MSFNLEDVGTYRHLKGSAGELCAAPHAQATMSTAMQMTVECEDISPDEVSESSRWTTALYKRKSISKDPIEQGGRASDTPRDMNKRPAPASVKKRLTTAPRLPRLPKAHFRIIIRPPEGLYIRKTGHLRVARPGPHTAARPTEADTVEDIICPNIVQNIFVASIQSKSNAMAYADVKAILIGQASYEVCLFCCPRKLMQGSYSRH
ncbi:hypothetical protein HPB49_018111 [Dermacentor silvarum]|uniref:Uncharacterized protein n=1 Tax=Dermacentor silvarum TaxID=543639 RepID=A0ACB8CM15_DERSI|nr:hypothetical protein HPB49_018111 [Dermacentor silvarum]